MNVIPVRHRLRSIPEVMRTEAECWRKFGRGPQADALEHYAQMIEGLHQQLLEEENQRKEIRP